MDHSGNWVLPKLGLPQVGATIDEFQNPTELYLDIELKIELSGRVALEISLGNLECKIELTRY